jgi:shikimate kinase
LKIFLIGMPGSGKTTLGRQLAQHLKVEFVDLDQEIERSEGKAIPEIFRQQGEDAFRLIEAKLLREWAAGTTPFVMSTGGGAPCFHHGMEVINSAGLSIFLDCPIPELVSRVKNNKDRPLLVNESEEELRQKLERMRETRLSCYKQAMIVLQNPSLDEVITSIGPRM